MYKNLSLSFGMVNILTPGVFWQFLQLIAQQFRPSLAAEPRGVRGPEEDPRGVPSPLIIRWLVSQSRSCYSIMLQNNNVKTIKVNLLTTPSYSYDNFLQQIRHDNYSIYKGTWINCPSYHIQERMISQCLDINAMAMVR